MNPKDAAASLPMEAKGDSVQTTVYLAVGHALSEWESLEFALSELYEALIGAEGDGAAAGYGTINAFTGRHDLLLAALEYCPFKDDVEIADASNLVADAKRFSTRRNEIAHGVVCHVSGKGFFLTPAWYSTRKAPRSGFDPARFNGGIGSYAYTSTQIAHYTTQFQVLHDRAERLVTPVRRLWREWRD